MIEVFEGLGCDCCGATAFCCCLRRISPEIPSVDCEIVLTVEDACCENATDWADIPNTGGISASCLWSEFRNRDCGIPVRTDIKVQTIYDAVTEQCTLWVSWSPNRNGGSPYPWHFFRKVFEPGEYCGGQQVVPFYAFRLSSSSVPEPTSPTAPPTAVGNCPASHAIVTFNFS